MHDIHTSLHDAALEELDFSNVLEYVAAYAATSLGADRIRALRPARDASVLRDDLHRVQEMVGIASSGDVMPFTGLSEVRPLTHKARIVGSYLTAPDLLAVQEALQTSRLLRNFFADRSDRSALLFSHSKDLVDNRMLERHISDAIDETGLVRDDASRDLQAIRKEIHSLSASLRVRLQRIMRKYDEDAVLVDEFVTQRDGRFVLPIKVENKRTVPGIIHGVSQSGSTVFLEPAETFEMNNDLSLLHNAEFREIVKILTTLTAEVATAADEIDAAVDIMIDVDVAMARARYAMEYGGIMPVIHSEARVDLQNMHHPVLAWQARRTRTSVVPLDVSFSVDSRGVLISGPNAGGKTVAMKTIGLSMLMAMSGIFPLGSCFMDVRDVYSAIGDHQSIDSNLSTFSSQLVRLRDILAQCGPHAVVLIDEICAGTDPAEGGALAAGVLDSLIQLHAFFVVTTHQSSLKQYALTQPSISNASLAFDEVRMSPTFTFMLGVPGNSYAFVLAKNVGLSDSVLQRGRSYLGERHNELEQSIEAIQKYRASAEASHREAAEHQRKAEAMRRDYEERLAAIKLQRKTLLEDARTDAAELLRKAQALIENTIREVREQQKAPGSIKQNFEDVRAEIVARDVEPNDESVSNVSAHNITPGVVVAVANTSNTGVVIEVDARTSTALVEINSMKFSFPLSRLQVGGALKAQRRDDMHIKLDASSTCDIRGMRAEEGMRTLEVFLSDAILGGLTTATILHGKGTGALRKIVTEVLYEHPHIASSRIGAIEEGGDGVTIVEFA